MLRSLLQSGIRADEKLLDWSFARLLWSYVDFLVEIDFRDETILGPTTADLLYVLSTYIRMYWSKRGCTLQAVCAVVCIGGIAYAQARALSEAVI